MKTNQGSITRILSLIWIVFGILILIYVGKSFFDHERVQNDRIAVLETQLMLLQTEAERFTSKSEGTAFVRRCAEDSSGGGIIIWLLETALRNMVS